MMRYINEAEVAQILTMAKTVELVETALKARADGRAIDVPRVRARAPAGTQHILQAAAPDLKLIGYKAYYSNPGKGSRYHVHLIDTDSGNLVAMIEASHLGMVRTGAASGVATKYMARENASTVGMIGAGKQAVGQLEAVCAVRKIHSAKVFSRKSEKARDFCAAMSGRLGIKMEAVTSAPEAVHGVDIINVITKASNPVLLGEWLEPGQHINAAGSNALTRRELDELAVKRSRVVVDSRGTARNECGDLLPLVETGKLDWDALPELGELITGRLAGRNSREEISLYESHGMGIQDIYTGHYILGVARANNIGIDLPIGG
ncbi:MAG TPA: ornithine cyclodeaminase family protein [Burkholderiales bacterium]|jgi:ornithine cyclodeaminase|nr:ornithine cyclodeaminase family protein [Burkholderiales bacterium]